MLGDGRGLQDVVMKELDDNAGKVLTRLDELGLRDNTIVIFTSDNGPETITWPDGGITPFRSEKGTTWEGGFRVPAIIRWPGHVPEGVIENGIMDAMDWMPTLVEAAGGPADLREQMRNRTDAACAHMDGINQMAMITGEGPSARSEVFYYSGQDFQAIR